LTLPKAIPNPPRATHNICRPKSVAARRDLDAFRPGGHPDRFIDELYRVEAAVVAVNFFRVCAVIAAIGRFAMN
jgi:hypothetical protein